MIDSIDYRLSLVDVATAQAGTSQGAYQAAQAAADAAQVTMLIDQRAVASARKYVADGLASLGHPVLIDNADGTSSVVEIQGTADYSIALTVSGEQNIPD